MAVVDRSELRIILSQPYGQATYTVNDNLGESANASIKGKGVALSPL